MHPFIDAGMGPVRRQGASAPRNIDGADIMFFLPGKSEFRMCQQRTCKHARIHTRTHAHSRTQVYVYMRVCVYLCVCMVVFVCACVYECVCV